jgi:hypothetical protein
MKNRRCFGKESDVMCQFLGQIYLGFEKDLATDGQNFAADVAMLKMRAAQLSPSNGGFAQLSPSFSAQQL